MLLVPKLARYRYGYDWLRHRRSSRASRRSAWRNKLLAVMMQPPGSGRWVTTMKPQNGCPPFALPLRRRWDRGTASEPDLTIRVAVMQEKNYDFVIFPSFCQMLE